MQVFCRQARVTPVPPARHIGAFTMAVCGIGNAPDHGRDKRRIGATKKPGRIGPLHSIPGSIQDRRHTGCRHEPPWPVQTPLSRDISAANCTSIYVSTGSSGSQRCPPSAVSAASRGRPAICATNLANQPSDTRSNRGRRRNAINTPKHQSRPGPRQNRRPGGQNGAAAHNPVQQRHIAINQQPVYCHAPRRRPGLKVTCIRARTRTEIQNSGIRRQTIKEGIGKGWRNGIRYQPVRAAQATLI